MADYHEKIYHYDPKEIRIQIEKSILFTLDRDNDRTVYAREAYKMIENLVKYLFALNESENVNFGVEITELAERCIKLYDPSTGTPFLTYFLAAWKNEYRRIKGKAYQEERIGGLHINKKVMQKIGSYVRYAKCRGIDYTSAEYVQLISDEIDRDIREIREYVFLIEQGVTPNELEDEDGQTVEAVDFSTLQKCLVEETLEQQEAVSLWARRIEGAFFALQERQKPLISDLLTLRIMDSEEITEMVLKQIIDKVFFSKEIYKRVLLNEKITARLIAEEHGITEQSASRSINSFLIKIRTSISKDNGDNNV